MDRMNGLDAAFQHLEDDTVALHLGATGVFEGPAPRVQEVRRRFQTLVTTVPRFGQRMHNVPLGLEWPVWVTDPHFDLTRHVQRAAVPEPGGEPELMHLVGEFMSQRLDPDRPLWQAQLVEGLAGGRWALVWKTHHSMVDGLAALEALSVLLDPLPGRPREPPRHPGRRAPVTANGARLVATAAVDGARNGRHALRRTVSAGLHPLATGRAVLLQAHNGVGYASSVVRPVRSTSLIGPLGGARRYRSRTVDLAGVDAVRSVLGGSVNDVAITLVTRGFRDLLLARHEVAQPRTVRALVPVSVRDAHRGPAVGNKVSALLLDLPVEFADAAAAHGAVLARMSALKKSGQAGAGVAGGALLGRLPPVLLGAALRAQRRLPQHVLATVITNVPGPATPMSLLGRRLISLHPYVPIGEHVRIGVALTSYRGALTFGVTCDRDAVPDADVLVTGITTCLAELVEHGDRIRELHS